MQQHLAQLGQRGAVVEGALQVALQLVRVAERGAVNNGATLLELREVLLHVAPYAGVPVTSAAFRAAEEWMAAEGLQFDASSS